MKKLPNLKDIGKAAANGAVDIGTNAGLYGSDKDTTFKQALKNEVISYAGDKVFEGGAKLLSKYPGAAGFANSCVGIGVAAVGVDVYNSIKDNKPAF